MDECCINGINRLMTRWMNKKINNRLINEWMDESMDG